MREWNKARAGKAIVDWLKTTTYKNQMIPKIISILYTLSAVAMADTPVLIFINEGDGLTGNASYFEKVAARAVKLYKSQGYEVHLVNPTQDLRSEIIKTFGSIHGASKIEIISYGHGNVFENGPSDAYPAEAMRNKRSANHFAFINSTGKNEPQGYDSPDHRDLGAGEFATWIKKLKTANPSASVTVNMQNCYSGMAARRLNREGIEAYSSTSDSEFANYKRMNSKKTSYIEVYLDEMERSANDSPRPSPRALFERARKRWVSIPEDNGHELYSDVPWGPLEAKINQWCDDHQELNLQNKKPIPEILRDIKNQSNVYLHFEHVMGERRLTSGECSTQALKRISQASADIKAWLPIIPASHAIEPRFTDDDPSECVGSEESLAELCLNWIKSNYKKYPGFSKLRLESLKQMFEHTVANCPPPLGKFDDYKACYDKFWTAADDKDRLSLLAKPSSGGVEDRGSSAGASE